MGRHDLPHQKVVGLAPAYFLTLWLTIRYCEDTKVYAGTSRLTIPGSATGVWVPVPLRLQHNNNSNKCSLFEKQRGAQNGPRESLWGSLIWLAKWLLTKKCSGLWTCLFIGWDCQNGAPVMMYAVLSHHICHLAEVWG